MANNDEPLNVIYITSSYPQETYVYDGLKASKINVLMDGEIQEVKVNVGDYVIVKNYQHDDPVVHEWWNDPQYVNDDVAYVYTSNGKWMYVSGGHDYDRQTGKLILGFGRNVYNCSGSNAHFLDGIETYKSADEIIGNRSNVITSISDYPEGHNTIDINDYTPSYHEYGVDTYYEVPERTETPPITTEAEIGDLAEISYNYHLEDGEPTWDTTSVIYQYPGVWVHSRNYPDLNIAPILPVKPHVQIKWTDPQDITDWKPTPATWEGTVIVRKENTPPLHRWDGTKVVRSTTRDEYKTNAYKDEDVKTGKVYYYGFFPYYTKTPDPDHPIRFYTFTKYIRVETGVVSYAPVINSIETNADTATINYTIIAPTSMGYATARLYGKIGSNPACDETDDIMLVVDQTKEEIEVTDLLYDTQYNFCIQVTDNTGEAITSNVVSTTAEDPVPPELKPYISTMNDIAAYKFAWANIPSSYYTGYPLYTTIEYQYPATNYSYSTDVYSSTVMDTFSNNFSYSGLRVSDMRTYNILTLNVTKNSGTNYTGRIDFPAGSTASIHNIYNPKNKNSSWASIGVSSVESGNINFVNWGNTGDGDTTNDYVSYSGTLVQVFAWFADRFRNIDIFVDGVQYAKSHYSN